MLYHLLYPLKDLWFGFNVFKYITFRAAMASITAFLLSVVIAPIIIKKLLHLKVGESPRRAYVEDLYKLHKHKEGTPTMGGVIIILSILLSTLLWARLDNRFIILCLISVLWLGIVGFIDDYIKLIKLKSSGLSAAAKFTGQLVLGIAIALYLYFDPQVSTHLYAPFFKHALINLGILYILFVIIVIVGTSNAVNLTDGLDGLAVGCVSFIALTYGVISYLTSHIKVSGYLNIYYLPGSGELTVFCACLAGSALGFLWFNSYPATVFMGDTGSLALGGTLAVVALMTGHWFLLPVIAIIPFSVTVSWILQVAYFRWTKGRRLFKMAPLHHHFELSGWSETQIVQRFWIVALLSGMFGVAMALV